jgi:hypothetical protein
MFYHATTTPDKDKNIIYDDEIKKILNLPNHIISEYDLKKNSGAYERLWDILIISLCADIEFFFKSLFLKYYKDENLKNSFFQRINDVIKLLESKNLNFNDVKKDIKKLDECFQIRHIAIHNMGFVDEKFKSRINTNHNVNTKYIINQKIYLSFSESYSNLLSCIDNQIT